MIRNTKTSHSSRKHGAMKAAPSPTSNSGSEEDDLLVTAASTENPKGPSWGTPKVKYYKSNILQSQWENMLSSLLEYKALKGNCLVPHRYKENPALGGE